MGNSKNRTFKIAKLQQWLSLITCFLMIVAVAVNRDGKVLGHELKDNGDKQTALDDSVMAVRIVDDTLFVNTTDLGKDIIGYAGAVPLEVAFVEGKVQSINPLPNDETPSFFDRAFEGLKDNWLGKKTEELAGKNVDVVSGATFTSNALIANMNLALEQASENSMSDAGSKFALADAKSIIGLIVVLMAAILPLFIKNKKYNIIQLILNVIVLGLWCGTFISYTLLVRLVANGANLWIYAIPLIMIVTAFIYPLFGRKQHYCTYVCPFGSLQQLAGKCSKKKIKLGQKTIKALDIFRQVLWAVLMICLWCGVFFEWMDYELFSAFIFQSAPVAVIVAAVAFTILSVFVPRPYCRFVCPTGTLMKTAELNK